VRHRAAFENRYGRGIRIGGQYGDPTDPAQDSQCSNSGERLVLVDPFGNPVLEFTYSDAWHPSTDGGGFALERLDALTEAGVPGSWRPGAVWGGAPGQPVAATVPAMVPDLHDGRLRLRWQASPGQAIRVEACDSLIAPRWVPLQIQPMRSEPQTVEFEAPAPASEARFYRLVSP